MNKGLLVIATTSVMAASAGAGYYAVEAKSGPAAETVEAVATEPAIEPKYVEIEPLVIPIVRNDRIMHHVFLSLSLEVEGKGNIDPVLAKKVRLHNAFLFALYDRPILVDTGAPMMDHAKVKSIVMGVANRVLGDDIVKAVHIREAVQGV